MLMNRTDEQVKADEALSIAIQNASEAYGIVDKDEMLTEYVILAVSQKLLDSGMVVTNHPILLKDGDMPWYKILGIMSIHAKIADKLIAEGGDNG